MGVGRQGRDLKRGVHSKAHDMGKLRGTLGEERLNENERKEVFRRRLTPTKDI